MSQRPWVGLALSLGVHAAVILLVLAFVTRDELLPALMVDLREAFAPGAASVKSPARDERPAPPPRAREPRRSRKQAAAPVAPHEAPSTSPAPAAPPAIVEAPPIPPAPVPPPPVAREPSREPPRETTSAGREATPAGRETAPAGREAAPVTLEAGTGGAGRAGGTGAPTAATAATTGAGAAGGAARGEESGPAGPLTASVPPGGGSGSGVGAEYGPYLAALRQRIQQTVRYPASARRRGLAGTVNVEILIQANGAIGDVTLLESSSHPVLDEAALDTIRALPRMPLPPDLPARPLRVRVPVVFQMR